MEVDVTTQGLPHAVDYEAPCNEGQGRRVQSHGHDAPAADAPQQPMSADPKMNDDGKAHKQHRCALADRTGTHGYWNALEYCHQ
eukprot:2300230-Pyramimonas_sp.AAC.1